MNDKFKLAIATWLVVVSFNAFSAETHGYRIGAHHSGLWFNADQAGHGFKVEVVSDKSVVIYWYAYHHDGTPMWLLAAAEVDGDTATGQAHYHSGMRFGAFDPAALNREPWGTVSLRFIDCFNARLSFDSTMSANGQPFGSGEIDLQRLTAIDGLPCPVSLEPGYFGNYAATLEPDPAPWTIDYSFITVHRNGDIAYRARSRDTLEFGLGKLEMTGTSTFTYLVETSAGDGTTLSYTGTREGTGRLEDGSVLLDLGELGTLVGQLSEEFYQPVTLEDLAGDYVQYWMNAVFSGFTVAPDGTLGSLPNLGYLDCGRVLSGQLTLPEPGRNQVKLEATYQCQDSSLTRVALGEYDPVHRRLYLIEYTAAESLFAYPSGSWYQQE